MSVRILHNPRCSKSRQTLELLLEKQADVDIIEYLSTPPSSDELKRIITLLGIRPRQLLRTGEDDYKLLDLADPALDDETIIAAMASHPRLIERPIVIVDDCKAVIGRPPEKVLEILP